MTTAVHCVIDAEYTRQSNFFPTNTLQTNVYRNCALMLSQNARPCWFAGRVHNQEVLSHKSVEFLADQDSAIGFELIRRALPTQGLSSTSPVTIKSKQSTPGCRVRNGPVHRLIQPSRHILNYLKHDLWSSSYLSPLTVGACTAFQWPTLKM